MQQIKLTMQCLDDDSGILAVVHSHEWLLPVKSEEVVGWNTWLDGERK